MYVPEKIIDEAVLWRSVCLIGGPPWFPFACNPGKAVDVLCNISTMQPWPPDCWLVFDKDIVNLAFSRNVNAKGKPVTGDAIILRPNQAGGYDVLLITRKRGPHQGGLALPGGIKEAMDPAGDSFIGREALEEVGLTTADITETIDLEPKLDRHSWDVRATNGVDVHGKIYIVDDSFKAVAADDALSHKWVSMDDIVTTDIAFGHSEWIADAAKEMGVDKGLVNKLDSKVLDDIKRNIKFMQEVSKKRLADGQPDFNFNKMGEEAGSRISLFDDAGDFVDPPETYWGDMGADLEGSPDMPLSSAFDKHMAGMTLEELSEWYGEKYGRDYITDTKTMTLEQF